MTPHQITDKMKVKEKSLQVLEKELDAVFSDFIRLRDCRSGMCRCFVCNAWIHWKYAQNGHFIPRAKMPTRYHEKNCHAVCEACNVYDAKHQLKYGVAMVNKYGIEEVESLMNLSRGLQKFMRSDITELITNYTESVSILKRTRI